MGIKERRDREKQLRKREIMDAAKLLFFEQGFAATSMNQIAQKLELSKGTLYLYFKNKEELYISLLVEGMALLNQAFESAVEDLESGEEKLRAIGWAYYQYSQEYPQYFHINFQFQQGEITRKISDELYRECFELGFTSLGFLAHAIEQGKAAGQIHAEDPMNTAVVLWASLTGIIFLNHGRDHRKFMPAPLDRLIKESIEISIKGLKLK